MTATLLRPLNRLYQIPAERRAVIHEKTAAPTCTQLEFAQGDLVQLQLTGAECSLHIAL